MIPLPAFEEYGRPMAPDHIAFGSDACVFLDRDGVINRRRILLVRRWGHFKFVPGVEHALARLAKLPVRIVVVTNQDSTGVGYIRETELTGIHREMVGAVAEVGGRIDAVYACVHAPWTQCECRKPLPGMLKAAGARYGLDPAKCWMVGDNAKDMAAGKGFGCRTILVDPRRRTRMQGAEAMADLVFEDTPAALEHLADAVGAQVRSVA